MKFRQLGLFRSQGSAIDLNRASLREFPTLLRARRQLRILHGRETDVGSHFSLRMRHKENQ